MEYRHQAIANALTSNSENQRLTEFQKLQYNMLILYFCSFLETISSIRYPKVIVTFFIAWG